MWERALGIVKSPSVSMIVGEDWGAILKAVPKPSARPCREKGCKVCVGVCLQHAPRTALRLSQTSYTESVLGG